MKCPALVLCALVGAAQAALISQPAAYQRHRCPSATVAARTPVVCAAQSGESGPLRRVISGMRKALFLGAASVLMRSPVAAPEAFAVTSATTTTKQVSTNGLPALTTIAMGGGLVYWSIKEAKEEDEEEQQRVVDETARLDDMQKEYTDIDEGVSADEDLFASLSARLNSTETITGSEDDDTPLGDFNTGPPPSDPLPPTASPSSGGGSAVLEPPSDPAPEPADEGPAPGATPEDIERLKRMFGSTES